VQSESLSVIEERMPPGTSEARHRHRRARQFFYVLEGTLHIEGDGRRHLLHHGEGLEIAPGAAHQVRNDERDAVRFLVVSQPPSHGDRELA
jgi:mannose-6-phosphate isomerase-like protein (cupin superfamily)